MVRSNIGIGGTGSVGIQLGGPVEVADDFTVLDAPSPLLQSERRSKTAMARLTGSHVAASVDL